MVENNNKGNNSFSFVEVATENINMKREREEMLARKRKINPSNKQEESNKKKEKLEKGTKKHLSEVRVGLFLSEEDMRMLRIYLFSLEPKESLTSFVNSLVKSKIKLIKKEFTEQSIMTLLGLENKE